MIFGSGDTLMLKSVGKCQGPNGEYELFIDTNGQPVVRSVISQRKFRLSWQNIVEQAVNSGVDDKPTYNIQCEAGRFKNEMESIQR